ncbi:MAG TPA: DUF1501 domain-containing protein, partial [Pirellulaceae bacterium]|nr:DUF1501 domain-containing protein [Pirellulaceae bacterium]
EEAPKGAPPKSLIVLYMEGGPSQLETFDPHPGTKFSHASTKNIKTTAKDIEISDWLPQVAEQMEHISLVRSVFSKEGDHERAAYNIKTGWRPDPTLVHPSLGAILCHQTLGQDKCEIPRHVSILPGPWAARGGYLGDQYDAFKTYDPNGQIPDITAPVSAGRAARRLDDLENVVEKAFAQGRVKSLPEKTLHSVSIAAARKMMTSEQLKAFDVREAPESLKQEFGDTPFGRACLAAVQLVGVGVRCVEVTLSGWDTHVNNEELVKGRCDILDPAFATLIKQLQERDLFDSTVVLWGGEFGRSPTIRGLDGGGRDHWPHGFTMALAGGGIKGGRVIGETAAEPKLDEKNRQQDVKGPRNVEDIHATVLQALGVDYTHEELTPIGRPMRFTMESAQPIDELLV